MLYVVGRRGAAERAEVHLRAALDAGTGGEYELEVVDLERDPRRAERDRIIAVPTALRASPGPERRAVGDLSDAAAVCRALALPFRPA